MTHDCCYVKVKCDPCNKCTHFYFIKISPLKFNESLFFIQQCSVKVFLLLDTNPFVEQLVPGLRLDHHRVSRLLEPHRMEVHRHAGINDTEKYLSRQQKIYFTNIKYFWPSPSFGHRSSTACPGGTWRRRWRFLTLRRMTRTPPRRQRRTASSCELMNLNLCCQ